MDREERPDIDDIYVSPAYDGRQGVALTMFLLPDGSHFGNVFPGLQNMVGRVSRHLPGNRQNMPRRYEKVLDNAKKPKP